MTGGVFITFEGGDGAGKTTHITFLARALATLGREVVHVREPGSTAIGEALRRVVLDAGNGEMADECELLVYEAARAQLVRQTIIPAIERGAVVLCDRFCDSTVAYQAAGRGIDRAAVEQANAFASCGIVPDRTVMFLLSAGAGAGLERAVRETGPDRMEGAGADFHERVDAAFRRIAREDPERVRVVYSQPRKSDTARAVFAAVADVLGWDDGRLPFDDAFFEQANELHGSRLVHEAQEG